MDYIIADSFDGKRRRLYERTCLACGKIFYVPKHRKHKACSYACKGILRRNKISCVCATCGEEFLRTPSKLCRSKSGLLFCGRLCKEKAQRIGGITSIQPPHYKDGSFAYRQRAFREYGKVCVKCGYKKYESMLDVDHKDGNKKNNDIENLQVLCVWCHACKTRKVPFHKH